MSALSVTNLSVTFQGRDKGFTAVRDVSFDVGAGETFGLIGPSGCGKTTVLRAIAGLNTNWQGSIAVSGEPLQPGRKITGALRASIQMVFQDPYSSLHPRHRIARILGEPLSLRGERDVEGQVRTALERVGLPAAVAGRYPHQLSGGQRQRVAIARALLLKPKLLLLDEPTSALDLAHQASMLSLVESLSHERGLTVVIVLHDINLAARHCDEIIALNRGRISAKGTPEEIMQAERLQSIFGVGMGVFTHPARGEPVSYLL